MAKRNPKLLTDSEAIDALGGTAVTARLFEVASSVVSNWRTRGIPGRYQYAFAKVCADKQIAWEPCGPQVAASA